MILSLSQILFLAAVALLPVSQIPIASITNYPIQLSDAFFVSSFLLWATAVAQREITIRFDRMFIFVALYGAVLAASILTSENRSLSIVKFAGELYLFSIAFISFQLLIEDERMLRRTVLAWAVGVMMTAAFTGVAVVLFYLGFDTQVTNPLLSHFGSLPEGPYPRVRSLFSNANMMTNYLNIAIPLLAVALSKGWLSRAVQRFAAIGGWASALLTISPGIGGMALSSAIRHFRERSRASLLILGMGTVTALGFLSVALISPDTKNTDAGTIVFGRVVEPSVRVLVWENSLEAVYRRPILGRGVGIDPAGLRYEAVNGDVQFLRDAHNMFLNVAGQSGLLGLAALLLLLGHIFSRLRHAEPEDAVTTGLFCAFVGAVLYQGLTGSFENARHVWVLFGMIAACTRR